MESDRDGDERPAVRIGIDVDQGSGPGTRLKSRWLSIGLLGALVVGGVALVVGLADGGEDPAPTTTTPVQPIAEPEPVTVYAAAAEDADDGDEWNIVDIGYDVRLGDVISSDSGFLAVGRDIDGTGLWSSTDGVTWEMRQRLELPPGVDESAMSENWYPFNWALFERDGQAVVFGWLGDAIGIWFDGAFAGLIEDEEAILLPQVLVGEKLLVGSSDGWLVSEDGNEWASVVGLPEEDLYAVGYVNGYYYLGGRCGSPVCESGQMYRSGDGVTWEAVEVAVPVGATDARVRSIAVMDEGLIAVGSVWVSDYAPAMWQFTNSTEWVLTELDDVHQTRPTTVIELIAANPVTEGTAVIAVDGVEHTLPEGSLIETGVGPISVLTVNNDNVILDTDGAMSVLELKASMTATPYSRLDTILSRGDHAVIGGARFVHALDFPEIGLGRHAAWITRDGGGTWEASTFDRFASLDSVALSEDAVLLVGQTETTSTIVAYREFATE